jgi:hypothetical protein
MDELLKITDYDLRHLALAYFLEVSPQEVEESYTDHFDTPEGEYWVLTESQANDAAYEYVEDYAREDLRDVPSQFHDYINLDQYVRDEIDSRGRGDLLASYDSAENEVDTQSNDFRDWVDDNFGMGVPIPPGERWLYLYRTN